MSDGTFVDRPPVVGSGLSVVDLLKGLLTDAVDEDPTRAGLDVEAVGVPELRSPNSLVLTCGVGNERVGDGAIGAVGDRAIPVYPERLAGGSTQSTQGVGGRQPGMLALARQRCARALGLLLIS